MSANSQEYLHQLFGLDGKTAVVIGATGVLGGEIALALAGAGAHVLVVGRNAESGAKCVEKITAQNGSAEFLAADSTNRADLENIITHLKSQNREADVLVNGAGTNSATPFLEIPDDEWERIFAVNLNSVRLACQVFGKFMLEKGTQGSIINVASLTAIKPLSRVFTYSGHESGCTEPD